MKIEINIDVERIVQEEIRNYVRDNVVINNTSEAPAIANPVLVQTTVATQNTLKITVNTPEVDWEFSPKPGRRRSKEEIALHELELQYGRLLTPEEKGETKAVIEVDADAELKAKENKLKQIRIDGITREITEATEEEFANSPKEEPHSNTKELFGNPESKEEEAVIPKTVELRDLSSLFSE